MEFESGISSRRMLAVTEEELNRIVLDIHDGPVQYLFAALSLLTRIQHQATLSPEQYADLLPTVNRVASLVEDSLHEIKAFLGTFRPPEFQQRSLASLLEGLILQHEERTGHTVYLTVEQLPSRVPLPLKIALYRLLQEALSNAFRHSGTQEQWARLWNEEDYICLEYRDNGTGFEPPLLDGASGTEREEHIGLRGMRDRVKLVGGTFQLVSHPGKGTQITVKIPITEKMGGGRWLGLYE